MTYDETPGLNWSTLKHLAVSALMLRWRVDHPRADTPALMLGRAIHCAVLEPERWASDFVAEPDFGDRRTKAAKAEIAEWISELSGRNVEILKWSVHSTAQRSAHAVHSHPIAAELLRGGRVEETVTWQIGDIECKGRLDYIRPTGLLDLKSTRHESIRLIVSDCARYLTHGQLAWYHDGAIAARLIPDNAEPPHVIFVQTTEPYDVIPSQLSSTDLVRGRSLYRDLLARYIECVEAKWWPGLAPDVIDLELPGWAAAGADETQGDDW